MANISIIGRGMKSYAETLRSDGYGVKTFYSVDRAIEYIPKTDLLVIDVDLNDSIKELAKASAHLPKIILSTEESSTRQNLWLRRPFAFPLFAPSQREFLNFTGRILKESNLLDLNEQLAKNIEHLSGEISFFEEINKMLTSSQDINSILVLVMKKIKDLIQAEAWAVMLHEEDSGDLVLEHTGGKATGRLKQFRVKSGVGIGGWVAQKGIPAVVADTRQDSRYSTKPYPQSNFPVRTAMAAPIKSHGKVIGVLEVMNKANGKRFNDQDLALLMKFVDQAALAVERIMLYQKLQELAITDDLTNLFNTRYLNRSIEAEVMRSERHGTSLCIIFMDIDYFKNVNDNHGHLVGSKLLVEMGQLLINQVRSIDIVARYGGDEFVLVLPQTSPKDAIMIAERTRREIEETSFLKVEGYDLRITASFGISSYPESAKSKEELLRLADEAMYKVKHRNRNGVYAIV